MIKNGTRPVKKSHKDFDYLKSHHGAILSGAIQPPTFPAEYLCDFKGNTRNQNINDTSFSPIVAAEPEGCTNYTSSSVATDLTEGKTIYRPDTLEALTHANQNGGFEVRDSLTIAMNSLKWFSAIFAVIAHSPLDYFDTFRLAIFSGAPEMRSISIGTPWFPSWEEACQSGVALMPMPTSDELAEIFNPNMPWHNHKLDGWFTYNSQLVLRDESWQGTDIGDNGYVYFTRDVINAIMTLQGTGAFTASRMGLGDAVPVTLTYLEWITSFVRTLFGLQY